MARIKSGFIGERAIILPSPIIDDFKLTELGRTLHITDIGFYPKATFHFRKRCKEEVKQYILLYCIEGEGWFELEHQHQKVTDNQVFILPKDKAHAYGSNKNNPWTIYWIHFDGEKAGFIAEGLDKPINVCPEKDSRIEERFKLFEVIYSTLRNGYSKNNLEFSITALFYFLGSIKYLHTYRECSSTTHEVMERNIAEEAIHFMRENIHKRITLKDIAEYVGFSSSHFSSNFQRKTGFSPLNYFAQLKIQVACHHLDFTDMKINQISMLLGFEDPFYFSRIFTKIMGISPSEYRSRKKG